MFQNEDEVRAALRLAVAGLPAPVPALPDLAARAPRPRRTWLPVVASAATVTAVVLLATTVTGRHGTPAAAAPKEVAFAEIEPRVLRVTAGKLATAPPGTRACAAADLRVDRVDNRPYNYRRLLRVAFRNVSDSVCAVSGFPDFDLVDAGGAPVTFPVNRVAVDARPLAVEPDLVVSVDGEWEPWCQADPGALRLRLRPPGGGLLTTDAVLGVAACRLVTNLTVGGTRGAGLLILREWAGVASPGSEMSVLEARLEVPASVRRGTRASFAVVLTNPTDRAVRLVPEDGPGPVSTTPEPLPASVAPTAPDCPVYAMRLDVLPAGSAGHAVPGYARPVQEPIGWNDASTILALNCRPAPSIGAHESVRFLMELAVPATMPVGQGWLSWDADRFGAFRAPSGRPSHEVWAEVEVTG